jgi:hypothetical protein
MYIGSFQIMMSERLALFILELIPIYGMFVDIMLL